MIIVTALIGAIILLWLCSRNWRASVEAALYVVVLEGALRKWVLPQASEMIYFLKDGILLGAYFGYLTRERTPFRTLTMREVLLCWITLICSMMFFEALNPALNSILVGILGVKGYLFYVPLAFLLPDLFRSIQELQRFLRWYLLFSLPICLLGIIQFFAPPDSFINVYAPSMVEVEVVAFEEGNVRVTGTFPYLGGYSAYLTLCLGLIFAVLLQQRLWRWRLVVTVVLFLNIVNSFMTGSRGVMLSAAILLIGFMVYSLFESSPRSRSLAIILVVACGLCGAVSFKVFPAAIEAFLNRASDDSDSISQRMFLGFSEPLAGVQYSGLGGYGAGATQVAGYALRDQLRLGPPLAYPPPAEVEPLRVMLEIGPFGFIAWYGLRIYFLWLLWRRTRTLRHPALRHLALAALLFHALLLPNQVVTNTAVGVFYWFLAGFAFSLPKLDRLTPGMRRASRHIAGRNKLVISALPELTPTPAASS